MLSEVGPTGGRQRGWKEPALPQEEYALVL